MRHGQRADFQLHEPTSEARDASVTFNTNQTDYLADPPLTPLGHQQATQAGRFIGQTISELAAQANATNFDKCKVRIVCSPFVRVLQTTKRLVEGLTTTTSVPIENEVTVDYLLSEWQAAYLYPGKSETSASPLESIILRTQDWDSIHKRYLSDGPDK